MDDRLQNMAMTQSGTFGVADAARVGVSPDELTTLIRRKRVYRVRRGAYVLAAMYDAASHDQKYRLRVQAVLRSRPADRASHHSALVMLGIATYDVDYSVVEVESRTVSRRRKGTGLVTNPRTTADTWSLDQYSMVSPAQACVQVAATAGFTAAVCAMDSAMFRKRCTPDEIRSAAMTLPPIHRTVALRALAASDPAAESVGESRTRIILADAGFAIESQVEISVEGRSRPRRVDFLVDGCVVVEFDGMVKYDGIEGQANLADEKFRETRLVRLGYEVVRVIWSDLASPQALVREVRRHKALALERRRAMQSLES